ncbi:hypothetical protein PMAYCL1PPCAC_14925, partial [Pristionchus mayeri]
FSLASYRVSSESRCHISCRSVLRTCHHRLSSAESSYYRFATTSDGPKCHALCDVPILIQFDCVDDSDHFFYAKLQVIFYP